MIRKTKRHLEREAKDIVNETGETYGCVEAINVPSDSTFDQLVAYHLRRHAYTGTGVTLVKHARRRLMDVEHSNGTTGDLTFGDYEVAPNEWGLLPGGDE